jgi:hypothetical protein
MAAYTACLYFLPPLPASFAELGFSAAVAKQA